MPISVTCHGCSKILRISDDVAGMRFRCNACGTILLASAQADEKKNTTSSAVGDHKTATAKNRQANRGKAVSAARRKKRQPDADLPFAQADTDWNETSGQDDSEWHDSKGHSPTLKQAGRKISKPLSKVFIRIGLVLLCIIAIPLTLHTMRAIRWSMSGSGIVCNSPPFGEQSGSVRVPDTWTVASVSRRLDGSGVRIFFEDGKFSDHPETRTIFELSVIHLSPTESEMKLFRDDGQLDPIVLGYTGSGFSGAMTLAPPEGESHSTSYRTVDGIEFTRISWSAADSMVREGQLVQATTNYVTYWGRQEDVLILMAGGYTTRNLNLLHPADAIAGTLQHGCDEAFVPATGVRASDYPQSQDIPRHELKTLDEF